MYAVHARVSLEHEGLKDTFVLDGLAGQDRLQVTTKAYYCQGI